MAGESYQLVQRKAATPVLNALAQQLSIHVLREEDDGKYDDKRKVFFIKFVICAISYKKNGPVLDKATAQIVILHAEPFCFAVRGNPRSDVHRRLARNGLPIAAQIG